MTKLSPVDLPSVIAYNEIWAPKGIMCEKEKCRWFEATFASVMSRNDELSGRMNVYQASQRLYDFVPILNDSGSDRTHRFQLDSVFPNDSLFLLTCLEFPLNLS